MLQIPEVRDDFAPLSSAAFYKLREAQLRKLRLPKSHADKDTKPRQPDLSATWWRPAGWVNKYYPRAWLRVVRSQYTEFDYRLHRHGFTKLEEYSIGRVIGTNLASSPEFNEHIWMHRHQGYLVVNPNPRWLQIHFVASRHVNVYLHTHWLIYCRAKAELLETAERVEAARTDLFFRREIYDLLQEGVDEQRRISEHLTALTNAVDKLTATVEESRRGAQLVAPTRF